MSNKKESHFLLEHQRLIDELKKANDKGKWGGDIFLGVIYFSLLTFLITYVDFDNYVDGKTIVFSSIFFILSFFLYKLNKKNNLIVKILLMEDSNRNEN